MQGSFSLAERLQSTDVQERLIHLYGNEGVDAAKARYGGAIAGFQKAFGVAPTALLSAPGRTELGGNHTDHQHGRVLAAAINLDIIAAARPNESGTIRVMSEGYAPLTVELGQLSPQPAEKNTSAALIRGVAARFAALGCCMEGKGLDAYLCSNVPGGSGLSSSAAFEVLMGELLNRLHFGGMFSPVQIAQIGQYAENVFFGKPCGLMDQTACSVGGVVAIDFRDPKSPVVERHVLDLAAQGYALCILDSGADHADLTAEYAAITDELRAVSRHFGKDVLRDVAQEDFLSALPAVRSAAGDRAVLRALHFYAENERAAAQAAALAGGDFDGFLKLVRESGHSSAQYLQNVVPVGQTLNQELMLAIALSEQILGGCGAVRVHGGGFGGTAQAFVPVALLPEFRRRIEAVLGGGSCHVLSIRPEGGAMLCVEG